MYIHFFTCLCDVMYKMFWSCLPLASWMWWLCVRGKRIISANNEMDEMRRREEKAVKKIPIGLKKQTIYMRIAVSAYHFVNLFFFLSSFAVLFSSLHSHLWFDETRNAWLTWLSSVLDSFDHCDSKSCMETPRGQQIFENVKRNSWMRLQHF